VLVAGQAGEVDEVPAGRPDGEGRRPLEPGREGVGDERGGPWNAPSGDGLEEIVLGVDDAAGPVDDFETDGTVGPAVDDDLVEPGPLEHVGEQPSRARMRDQAVERLVPRDPGGGLRRAGHGRDERARAAARRGHGRVVQGGRADDDPVPG
jgi:hypothetical protein